MLLDDDQCYRALKTHDARFDGRFFVGVGSTKIYCRPVCTARTPLKRNCRFYASAAAAEAEGYRPCLRCRPELAPGYAVVDANRRLAQSAAGMIEDGRLADANLESLAGALGVTDRHLRRVFQQEFGVAPVEYAQTQRLLLAKRLLTDSALPVIDVAMASGFASLRRFNDLFRTRYRMTPGELRRNAALGAPVERMVFELAYRPPYDWQSIHAFLSRRAIAGVETADARSYSRTVRAQRKGKPLAGWISVAPAPRRNALRVTVSASLAEALPSVLARVKQVFDVAAHPEEIAQALGATGRRAAGPSFARRHRRFRARGAGDPGPAGLGGRGDTHRRAAGREAWRSDRDADRRPHASLSDRARARGARSLAGRRMRDHLGTRARHRGARA
jgi:AraC family transcriptional regulator of adaptative response / DNA-3-methyladenine glycosylase II